MMWRIVSILVIVPSLGGCLLKKAPAPLLDLNLLRDQRPFNVKSVQAITGMIDDSQQFAIHDTFDNVVKAMESEKPKVDNFHRVPSPTPTYAAFEGGSPNDDYNVQIYVGNSSSGNNGAVDNTRKDWTTIRLIHTHR